MLSLETISQWINSRIIEKEFKESLAENLSRLCSINTIPDSDLRKTAENEALSFRMIQDLISDFGLDGVFKKHPISPLIRNHSEFTLPHYANSTETYANRYNLIYLWNSPQRTEDGRKIAINAHIDTVTPYLPVTRDGEILGGRGVCDDKSGCLVMIAALGLLKEIEEKYKVVPGNDLTFMFVIDEEMGGNGSLSLTLNNDLKSRYDLIIVLECCDQQIHPANRGAVWYKIEIPSKKIPQPIILAMEIIQELEKEGSVIKSESIHPLFPQCPVQISHGILGPFGEYPSRICGYLELKLKLKATYPELNQLIEEGVKSYTEKYGDKTKIINRETGRVKLEKHYDLEQHKDQFHLKVWGSTGHMAAILENDNAITKASFIINEIIKKHSDLDISFPDGTIPDPIILEGGQGFIPTHSLNQIKSRLKNAMLAAYKNYAEWQGLSEQPLEMTFEKLHNDAFDGNPDSPSMIDAIKCAELVGITIRRPIQGWMASCDARLFAQMNPQMEIITTGPGKLEHAHSDKEQINISELAQSCAMLTLFLLLHTCSKNILS